MHTPKNASGFTLVELMIVVVIIGILAAIAVPQFIKFQLRSKAGEVNSITGSIATAQEGFSNKWGAYALALPQPPAMPPSGQKTSWSVTPEEGFGLIGYEARGRTYHQYMVTDDLGYQVTNTTALPAIPGDGTFGYDAQGQPCAIPGVNGCSATNNVESRENAIDTLTVAAGDLDADGTTCTYATTDESKDILPNRSNGVCSENAF